MLVKQNRRQAPFSTVNGPAPAAGGGGGTGRGQTGSKLAELRSCCTAIYIAAAGTCLADLSWCRGRLAPSEVVRDVAAWRDAADGEWHG
jgi:hypothetical protein